MNNESRHDGDEANIWKSWEKKKLNFLFEPKRNVWIIRRCAQANGSCRVSFIFLIC